MSEQERAALVERLEEAEAYLTGVVMGREAEGRPTKQVAEIIAALREAAALLKGEQ